MNQHRCYGCMQMITEEVCPHCGYSARQNNVSNQLPVGTLLRNQYLVGKVLGQGGFGITYIGWDMYLDVPVAIKEFFPSSAVNRDVTYSHSVRVNTSSAEKLFENSRERFLQEAKILAQLRNIPEIVRIMGYFPANNTAYIIMEYVQGIDLRTYVRQQGGRLPPNVVFRILEPIVRALEAVHQAGLVHRDISPDNIMLQPNGIPKLLDFGAAHSAGNPDADVDRSRSTEAILKHGFAPFEQYRSRGNLGPWTDEYGLCATVFFCLTGEIPPDALYRLDENIHPNWNIPGLNAHQRSVLEKGMSIRAKDRFGSMRLLYDALYSGGSVTTRTPWPQTEPDDLQNYNNYDDQDTIYVQNSGPHHTKEKPSQNPLSITKAVAAAAAVLAVILLLMPLKNGDKKDAPSAAESTADTPTPSQGTVPILGEPEDPYQDVEDSCAGMWAEGEYSAVLQELRSQAATHPQDTRYVQLLADYEASLQNIILSEAERYAAQDKYRTAIQLLDDAWKEFSLPAFYTAAGDYRMAFGISNSSYIAAGKYNSVVIRDDGGITVVGDNEFNELEAKYWSDIVCVAAGDKHIVGLRSNGSVVTVGDNETGQLNVSGWNNVVAITAGDFHTIGLLEDGTLVAAGQLWAERCNVDKLHTLAGDKRIVSVAAGYLHTLALLEDGTVIATGENGDHQCDVTGWTDIAAIYAGTLYSVGLKTDGTVVIAGTGGLNGGLNCSGWMNIDNLAAGDFFIVGITADQRLLSVGMESAIGPNTPAVIDTWSGIRQVAAGNDHIITLAENGSVRCAGKNDLNQLHADGLTITYPRDLR